MPAEQQALPLAAGIALVKPRQCAVYRFGSVSKLLLVTGAPWKRVDSWQD